LTFNAISFFMQSELTMKTIPILLDTGTAYDRATPTHNAELTEVSRGTPMGEVMRRYWQPIGLSSYACDVPRKIRVLGEDLVVFRDKQGRPGLVYERCAHRGTSLMYGRIDDHGLRCCYHGWAFDVQGHCTDQPCEPNNGDHKNKVRQPWYPVKEQYGMLFAYLGPADKKPILPRFDIFENIPDDEQLFTDDRNIGSGQYFDGIVPFNWLQHFENIHDYGHFLWLHFFHSGAQFGSRYGELDKLDFQPWEWMKNLNLTATPFGIQNERTQVLPDGRTLRAVVETMLPGVRGVPNPFGKPGRIDTLGFMLPVDDTHIRIFTVLRAKDDDFFNRLRISRGNRDENLAADPDYYQKFPGDWEAQGSQGPITLHSEERLATSDRGIMMVRRQLKQQIDLVASGKDPIGVVFEEGKELISPKAGQYLSGEMGGAA
jgi:nitrite reductase/ring-hydroxylating ferredoxin subunit